MNLTQIRQLFVTLSGRHDLVEGNINQADFFIREGSKLLDRLTETQKTWGTHFRFLPTGGWNIQFPYCRAVKEVWAASTAPSAITEARWQLEKKDLQWMLSNLMTELVSSLDRGTPLYYSPFLTRNIGTLPAGIASYVDTITSEGERYNAVLILPPPSAQTLIEIKGFFYADELLDDSDENFWTVAHPSTLLKAALRESEVFNQNPTKVTNWEKAITTDIDGINKDLVEELVAEVSEMEG